MRAHAFFLLAFLPFGALAQEAQFPATEEESPAYTLSAPEKIPSAVLPMFEAKQLPPPNVIVLQGLNKVTARVSQLQSPLGAVMRFGNLEIIARRCISALPGEQPENKALLEIREQKPGVSPQTIFTGWMFSSSPGVSALEHPVYDVSVVRCEYRANAED